MEWLYKGYNKRKNEIKQRLSEFSRVSGDDIFYELCFCLMTPQSNGKRCGEVANDLMEKGFVNSEVDLVPLLKKRTRFHNHKATYLIQMKNKYNEILDALKSGKRPNEMREWLVKNIKGIGMKEASHFLRNIGYTDLAILDRHILKNLVKCRVIDSLPKPLNAKKYVEIEELFKKFSFRIGISMDELDLLFWSEETGEVFK